MKGSETMQDTICPRCQRDAKHALLARTALSRKDNETRICNSCSTDEAMRDWRGDDVWPGYPGRVEGGGPL